MTDGERLREQFPNAVIATGVLCGDPTVSVRPESLLDVLRFLKDELAYDLPLDVTAVDRLGLGASPRFLVVHHLRCLADGRLIRLHVPVPDDDPAVPSAVGVYRGLDWAEREVWDMFGIRFEGHPDLRRILLYPEFVGHPLRKDYPRRGYQPLMDMPGLNGDPVPGRED